MAAARRVSPPLKRPEGPQPGGPSSRIVRCSENEMISQPDGKGGGLARGNTDRLRACHVQGGVDGPRVAARGHRREVKGAVAIRRRGESSQRDSRTGNWETE